MTSVSSSRPRCFQILISAADGWSVSLALRRQICFGSLPCWSQPRWKSWMKRTPRSARRRASRQLAANVPGFRASGPYSSKTCSRLLRKIGQFRHRGLHPERHLVLRDARRDFGSPNSSSFIWFSLPRSSRKRRAVAVVEARRIRQVQHRIADRAELHALIPRGQEAAAPQPVVERLVRRCPSPARSSRRRPADPRSRCPARRTATSRCWAGRRAGSRSGRTSPPDRD